VKELINLRQLNSKTYDLGLTPDGKLKRAVSIQQGLHYFDDDTKQLEECDTSLVDDTSGEPFSHEAKKIQLPFKVDSATGKRRLYPVRGNKDKWVEFGGFPALLGLSAASVLDQKLSWNKESLSLDFQAIPEGLKFRAILKDDKAPSSFSFPVTLNNLTWDNWRIMDGTQVVCVVDKGYAVDSSKDEFGKPVYCSLTATYDKGIATFSLDTTAMTYPIEIDPSVTVQPSDADNWMQEDAATTNHGSYDGILVRSLATNQDIRTTLSFDFSGDIPAGSTIDSATLSLLWYSRVGIVEGRTYWAYRLTQAGWVEAQATWNIYSTGNNWASAGGDYTATNGKSTVMPAPYAWVNWGDTGGDMTTQVQYALDSVSGVAHFLIKDGTEESVSNETALFYSKENATAANRPKLYIEWTEAGTVVKDIIQPGIIAFPR